MKVNTSMATALRLLMVVLFSIAVIIFVKMYDVAPGGDPIPLTRGIPSAPSEVKPISTNIQPPHPKEASNEEESFPEVAVPKSQWAGLSGDFIDWDFSLGKEGSEYLKLSATEKENLDSILSTYRRKLQEMESLRAIAQSGEKGSTVRIPSIDEAQSKKIQSEFKEELSKSIGSNRAEFLLTAGKQGLLLASGNFGAVDRLITFVPGAALPQGGGGKWKVNITSVPGIAGEPSASGGRLQLVGDLVSKSFYFDEIPPVLSHLIEP